MKATLSILGLYNFDQTIFSGLNLPAKLNKTDFINQLLLESADLEILYPQPDILKQAISLWSKSRQHAWERIQLALYTDYNPLHNFDRLEDYSDSDLTTIQAHSSDTSKSTSTGKSELKDGVRGFNEGLTYAPDKKTNQDTTDNSSGESSGDSNSRNEHVSKHSGHLRGNIGVTKSQEMLRDELELRAEADLTRVIIREFQEKFCLLVY